MEEHYSFYITFTNTGQTATIQFNSSVIDTVTISDLKQKVYESLKIPPKYQQYPSLEKSKPINNSNLLSSYADILSSFATNIDEIKSFKLNVSSKNTWKTDHKHTNKKSITNTYMKLLIYWKRICFAHKNSKILFGTDVLNLILSFLSCENYKGIWSQKYKSCDISAYPPQHDTTWYLSGKGTIRCEDPLPHGRVYEFTFKGYCEQTHGWQRKCCGRPLIGIVDNQFNTWDIHDGMRDIPSVLLTKFHHFLGLTLNNGGIVLTERINHLDNIIKNRYERSVMECEDARYWRVEPRIEYCQIVVKEDAPYEYYSEVGNEVTVRVNLIDYVLSFWDTKKDKILQFRQTFEEDSDEDENSVNETDEEDEEEQEMENDMPVLYEPIVIEIPKDKNIKWYPAVYMRGHVEHGCTWSAIRGESITMQFEQDF